MTDVVSDRAVKRAPSPKTTVKICGLKNEHIVQQINVLDDEHRMEQIGFVFAPSKRQVSAEQAAAMMRLLQKDAANKPLAVGVFVNPTEQQLRDVLAIVPLDVIQLHGDEPPALCAWIKEHLRTRVYKVVAMRDVKQSEKAQTEAPSVSQTVAQALDPYRSLIDALLLDTYDPHVGGGTGETFAWERIPDYKAWTEQAGMPLIVAGGLHADNVSDLVRQYEPDGVDVSSGVETAGEKDIDKIKQFIERVNRA